MYTYMFETNISRLIKRSEAEVSVVPEQDGQAAAHMYSHDASQACNIHHPGCVDILVIKHLIQNRDFEKQDSIACVWDVERVNWVDLS